MVINRTAYRVGFFDLVVKTGANALRLNGEAASPTGHERLLGTSVRMHVGWAAGIASCVVPSSGGYFLLAVRNSSVWGTVIDER